MRELKDYNPIVVILYYMVAMALLMFSMNPVLHLIGFCGGLLQFVIFLPHGEGRTHVYYMTVGLILALIRPVFSHNGVTVLFVVNDNPITLESFIFGVNSAVMVISVLYLFRVMSKFMTTDRMLYVFQRISPKTALIMSMGLRIIPALRRRYRMIAQAQTATGINKDDNAIDRIKGSSKTLSATITWGLENGIITADSMAARYYGTGRRSSYSIFEFCRNDIFMLLAIAALSAMPVYCMYKGGFDTVFYPEFVIQKADIALITGYASFAMLILLCPFMHLAENLKWKRLRSKI